MRVTVADDVYELDLSTLRIKELRELKKQSGGMTIKGFTEGLAESDPDAVAAMVWLAKRRAGEICRFEDLDFDLAQFDVDLGDDADDEPAEGQAETPTAGDGAS